MVIHEYGSRDNPTMILLAPMMVSCMDLYSMMKPFFKGEYHIVAPDQGGHGQAGNYINADEEYRSLRSFLTAAGCTDITLVYGGRAAGVCGRACSIYQEVVIE